MFSVMPYTYGYFAIIYFNDARQVSRTGVIISIFVLLESIPKYEAYFSRKCLIRDYPKLGLTMFSLR
jgi:hypothetical protein